MSSVIYTATRSVTGSHVAGNNYALDFSAGKLNRKSKTTQKTHTARGGQSEALRYRQTITWDITTTRVTGPNIPLLREFLDSVDGGEAFTFDPYGTNATPDNPVSCKLESSGYSENRHGTTDSFRISFRVKQL